MAIPPSLFPHVTSRLGESGLLQETENDWRRVVIEKPFGQDLESAVALNRKLHDNLDERQIYRIDHYLGKETVQNIMVFRFANGFIEPLWNHHHIDHVQLTVAESVGVEHRGAYYEKAGALRDMIPNHLLVLLGFIVMEPPNSFESSALRDEVNKVLDAIEPLSPEDVLRHAVRGQYGEGNMAGGERVKAYRSSPGVDPQSRTETFAALKLTVDNWRWAGVPFYLRTGKRLAAQCTEIAIQLKRAPTVLFKHTDVEQVDPNMLVLRIQPAEGIQMSFGAKVPGPTMGVGTVNMDFCYEDYFGNKPATGYETLIYDCMKAMRPYTNTPTRSKRAGRSCNRSWTSGPRSRQGTSRTMPPGPGDPRPPAVYSRTTAVCGAGSRFRINDATLTDSNPGRDLTLEHIDGLHTMLPPRKLRCHYD